MFVLQGEGLDSSIRMVGTLSVYHKQIWWKGGVREGGVVVVGGPF